MEVPNAPTVRNHAADGSNHQWGARELLVLGYEQSPPESQTLEELQPSIASGSMAPTAMQRSDDEVSQIRRSR
jgi:hypothetical protein